MNRTANPAVEEFDDERLEKLVGRFAADLGAVLHAATALIGDRAGPLQGDGRVPLVTHLQTTNAIRDNDQKTTGGRRRGVRRGVATLALAAGVVGAAIEPAAAINSYNAQPAPERTEVGVFMALWDRDGDGVIDRFNPYCSGTMIDDDTFLSAAHCTYSAADWPAGSRWFVSLEEDVLTLLARARKGRSPEEAAQLFLDEGWAVEGDVHHDPAYPGTAADTHDIGVVDFADRAVTPADVWTFTPAKLPTADQLTELGSRALDAADWSVVGYGTQEAVRGPGGHTHPGGGVRLKAPLDFNALNPAWVRLSMVESRDLGGACYGDSGGPNFVVIDGELVLAATTITGEVPCYATNVAYRMDTPSARDFLEEFVTLP